MSVRLQMRGPFAQNRSGRSAGALGTHPLSASLRPRIRRLAQTALALVTVLTALLVPAGPGAQAAAGRIQVRGDHFVDPSGQPVFLLGVNYEGPIHQAWQMWDDNRFSLPLIRQDFIRAQGAGAFGVVRIFVQKPLADDIAAKRWAKLDQVLDLADQSGLRIILTFADYPESQLANLTPIDTAVASRYRGRSTILAYDLKNEPRFSDLALAQYPPQYRVPLQDPTLVPTGETISQRDIPAYRGTDQGQKDIPSRLSDAQAYAYANFLSAYRHFLAQEGDWATSWGPLKDMLNDTLATWIKVRTDAVHQGDPGALVTIGHVDAIIANLPANNGLDYRDFHRYPSASSASIASTMALLDDMRAALPTKPLVLGEFGFSNANVDEQKSASLEAEMVQSFRDHGGAGALKWMLNDFPDGFNARENAFGMYRQDGTPKPVVVTLGSLRGIQPIVKTPNTWPADYAMPNGRFFTQRNAKPDLSGFAVTNDDDIPFWDMWQALGLNSVGYPLSGRFSWRGLVTQVFEKAAFQWQPGTGVALVNLMDEMHDGGFDAVLLGSRASPLPAPPTAITGKTPEEITQARLALLNSNPAIKERYLSAADPILLYGLPTSAPQDLIDAVAIRTQRTTLQLWKHDTPWAKTGEVTTVNSGEIAAGYRLFPLGSLVPQPPPVAALNASLGLS